MLRLRGARCWNRILSTHLIQRYIRKRSSWFFTYGVNSISAVEFSWDASRSIRCTFELLVSISRNHCLSSKSIGGLTSGILQRVSLYLQRKPQALCSNGFGKIIVPGKDRKNTFTLVSLIGPASSPANRVQSLNNHIDSIGSWKFRD
ncbi:uncharacterized protein LOC111271277 isoform X2 [Varroa jacobsoni]|uniref:uncharacterized protein LOC111271277 isoform X2 n=1 Tax=Varroa jacobsoni TaxID=62625 RepID=UPI000BF274EA|nr:uncharacterized protein LOC111271277 isoform X2 [Varroa jacobsoni]